MKHHSETHIIRTTVTVMKQSKRIDGDLKTEHTQKKKKKTSNSTTMGPTTDIDRQPPTIWKEFRPTYRLAIKRGSDIDLCILQFVITSEVSIEINHI